MEKERLWRSLGPPNTPPAHLEGWTKYWDASDRRAWWWNEREQRAWVPCSDMTPAKKTKRRWKEWSNEGGWEAFMDPTTNRVWWYHPDTKISYYPEEIVGDARSMQSGHSGQ